VIFHKVVNYLLTKSIWRFIVQKIDYEKGEKFIITQDVIDDINKLLVTVIHDFDNAFLRKYQVPELIITQKFPI